MTVHGSLEWHRREGYRISAHCENIIDGVFCNHSGPLSWDKLIAEFGPDFSIPGPDRPRFMAKLYCSKCGSKKVAIAVVPPDRPPTYQNRTVW